jgi:hypothetical protein
MGPGISHRQWFSPFFLWFSYGFPMFFPHISPGISRDLRTLPHLVLRRLAKGHQLATGNKEARQDDQHATWKDERDKGMKIKLRDVFHLYNMRKSSGFKLKGYY